MFNVHEYVKGLIASKNYQKAIDRINETNNFNVNHFSFTNQQSFISSCCFDDNANDLIELLLSKNAYTRPNSSFNEDMPLNIAISNNAIKNVKSLLKYNARYEFKDLELTIKKNYTEIFKLLVVKFTDSAYINKFYLLIDPIINENHEIIDILLSKFKDHDMVIMVTLFTMSYKSNVDMLKYVLEKSGFNLSSDKLNDKWFNLSSSNMENFNDALYYLKDTCENFDEFMLNNREMFLKIHSKTQESCIQNFYETNY